MTLVVAQKTDDCILLFADTFSLDNWRKEKINWFTSPRKKIFHLSDEIVIAFAGNPYLIRQILEQNKHSPITSLNDLSDIWDGNPETDLFVVCRQSCQLFKLSDSGIQEVAASYIGSKSGFETFQKLKSDIAGGDDLLAPGTSLAAYQMPDPASATSTEIYGQLVKAFSATLRSTDGTFGGVPISYYSTAESSGFLSHVEVYRGPLDEAELGVGNWSTISFQDLNFSQYIVSVWGSANRSAFFFPDANTGLISDESESDEIYKKFGDVDGYEFSYITEDLGIGGGLSTWNSTENTIYKFNQYLRDGNEERAARALSTLAASVQAKWTGLGNDESQDWKPTDILKEKGDCTLDFEVISLVDIYFDLKSRHQSVFGIRDEDFAGIKKAWVEWKSSVRFSLSFN